jgi:hypothetical protein
MPNLHNDFLFKERFVVDIEQYDLNVLTSTFLVYTMIRY